MSSNRKNAKGPDELGILIASDVELEETGFVDIEGMLFPKRYISVVVGTPGMGKSTLVAWLIAAVTRAGHSAVYSSTEDTASVTRARIEAHGGDLNLVAIIDQDHAPVFPEDAERAARIMERMEKRAPLGAIIVDPFSDHLSTPLGNDQATRKALGPIARLADRFDCPFLMVGHTLKTVKATADPGNAVPGKALYGRCRRAYVFGVNPGDPNERAAVCIKDQFLGEKGRAYTFTLEEDLVEDENGTVVPVGNLTLYDAEAKIAWHDTLRPPEDGENSGKGGKRTAELLAITSEWLEDALAPSGENPSGLMRSSDMLAQAEADGISKATLRRAQKALGIVKERHGGKENIVWWSWLPETHSLRVEYLTDNPGVAGELTDEAISASIKATTPGLVPNPGVTLSQSDIDQLLGGQ